MARKDSPARRAAVATIKMGLASAAVLATAAGWAGLGMADPQNNPTPAASKVAAPANAGRPDAGVFAPALPPTATATAMAQGQSSAPSVQQPPDAPSTVSPPAQSRPSTPSTQRPRARTRSSR